MAIDEKKLLRRKIDDVSQRYGSHETALYALGLGLGLNPADEHALRFVVGPDAVLPTFATALAQNRDWFWEPDIGLDVASSVHAEQALTLHARLPATAAINGRCDVEDVIDKGAGRGAIVVCRATLTDAVDGALYATMLQSVFFRRDGGFGGSNKGGKPRVVMPARSPDATVLHPTSPQTALIYRLSGDRNPLHCDPEVARRAGFDRPILHGLASFGIAGYAIGRTFCQDDAWAMRSISCRFTAPAFPGDTLAVQLWRDASIVRFRVVCAESGRVVIDHGRAELTL
ncbi:MAG: hypothetical protein BGP06_10680 [Rhizobiales bacterium 65-9]|nr:MaoC family dehydratase N-terminal domain-containing protein [Hyphomicrobiales bacterium]OJY32408.1 MAG: hypothetical protein BGP06_10680 [Rhizobiales bacterium 65-9]